MINHGGYDGVQSAKREPARDPEVTIARAINVFLADTFFLMAKTQDCHWKASGPNFIAVHHLLEAQYRELFAAVDQIAERARSLRLIVPCGLLPLLELATSEEGDRSFSTERAAQMLVAAHLAMAEEASDLAEDAKKAEHCATHDMLMGGIPVHEKAASLLRGRLH